MRIARRNVEQIKGPNLMNNPTKSRGKSAINKFDKVLPSSSASTSNLLTIEQIPRTNYTKKVFHRSQSSLSLNYQKKIISIPTTAVTQYVEPEFDGQQRQSPSSTNRVRRSEEERSKLADRINLDKKGLTAIPIIEDEPNLRLLSLQHNLINTFHIPEEEGIQKREGETESHQQKLLQLQHQRSTTRRNQLVLHNSSISYSANGKPPNHPPNSSTKLSSNTTFLPQKTNSNNNAHSKFVLKKSNSFINLNQQIITTNTTTLINRITTTSNHLDNKLKRHKLLAMQTPSLSIENVGVPTIDSERATPECGFKFVAATQPKFTLSNLVFLDLYDNQIEKISNLDGLRSLTVLLLGKNRITDISGIVSLKSTLRVLDLHGNKITNITQKISQLQELKSLNLAGNALRQIVATDFSGLFSLKELNLKRNRLKKICGFDDLRSLERLWLCYNDIQKVADMGAVAKAVNLKEVTIQNNPVSLAGDCVSFLVSFLPALTTLSQMQITEQVRRAAMAWRKNKEQSDKNYLTLSTNAGQSIRREEIISNARTNWELLRSQQPAPGIPKPASNKIEIEVRSNISEPSSVLKPNLPPQPVSKTRQRYRPRTLHRTISQDHATTWTNTVSTITDDYFRLPPILAPYLNSNTPTSPIPSGQENSVCSMGPNIDSGSSVCSSENEATDMPPTANLNEYAEDAELVVKEHEPAEPLLESSGTELVEPLIERDEKRPVLAIISLNEIELDSNGADEMDKISNLSTVSAKTTTESVQTTSSDDQQTSSKAGSKCRSALPSRKSYAGMLRAQTAKNLALTQQAATAVVSKLPPNKLLEREREQGTDYLIEICGRYLNIYGLGSLKFIEKQWNTQKANDVHTIKFSYINFNSITPILCRLKQRFTNADHFVFRETNIMCLGQLNALAETQGITSLTIEPEGNAVTDKCWRYYAIYRLSHWGLKQINGTEITEEDQRMADNMYAGLSDLVLWSLPESLLQPLLLRLRLDETCAASRAQSAKEWLLAADASLKSVVGKEALQWKKQTNQPPDELVTRQRGKLCFNQMLENTCNAVEKLQRVDKLWETMLFETIRNALIDYSQIDVYVKGLLNELK